MWSVEVHCGHIASSALKEMFYNVSNCQYRYNHNNVDQCMIKFFDQFAIIIINWKKQKTEDTY